MQSYRCYPKLTNDEIQKYTLRPLPGLPGDFYFTAQTSASYESLLEHIIPSPSLIDDEDSVWHRISQCSVYSTDLPLTPPAHSRGNSLDTITQSVDSPLRLKHRDRRDTLLPPAPRLSRRRESVQALDRRSSSTFSQRTTPPTSPPLSKRSATPTLLDKLSSELDELSIQTQQEPQSLRSTTSLSTLTTPHAQSPFPEDSPTTSRFPQSLFMMDTKTLSPQKSRKAKPSSLPITSGNRNISPPMPSPINNHALFGPPLALVGTADSYQRCRPAPPTPDETQEVSRIEWDDDDDAKSRLTRMKKSFTDLRTAGRAKTDSTSRAQVKTPTSPPSQPAVEQGFHPPSHPYTTAVKNSTTTTPPRQTTVPIGKLSKNPSVKLSRKRGWSHTSTFSDKSNNAKFSTPRSTSTAMTALPRASSPHLTKSKKRKRFNIAATRTSGKGRKMGMRRVVRWMGRIFGC